MAGTRPPVWQMIREAADAGALSNAAIKQAILARYPGTNPSTINAQINYTTVNSPSRIHGPENQRVRLEPHNLDILYKVDRGVYQRYNPEKHGLWQIIKSDNGRYEIRRASDGNQDFEEEERTIIRDGSSEPRTLGGFAAEIHLRDYLAVNLHVIEEGLLPFVDEAGNGHVEYRTPVGIIDLICIDKDDNLLVIELKVDRSSDAVAGQILRYVNWIRRNVAQAHKVRGLIIAKSISERLLYSIDADPTIEAREYEMQVQLRPPAKNLPT